MATPPRFGSPSSPPGLSRRSLLQVGAAAAAPLVLGTRSRAAAIPRNAPEALRVGLIGCGGRGTGAASQALRTASGPTILTAVADVLPDRVDACLKYLAEDVGPEDASRIQVDGEHRFVGFDAYEKLLASDVDVVLLATPPHFRPAQLRAAVEAGKHIFCEKPMAVDSPGVRSVLESARRAQEKQLSVVAGFCWRRKNGFREAYARLHDGALGAVRAVYSTYNATPPDEVGRKPDWSDMEFQMRNWYHFVWLSGDHVVEQACHSLDKMAWTLGDRAPRSCIASGGRQVRSGAASGNVFDHFSATFDYGDGVRGFHMSRQWVNTATENLDYVMAEKGHATLNGWANDFRFHGAAPWRYEGEDNDMYQTEIDELLASIREGKPIHDGEWMAHSTLLAIMVRQAAYTGDVVTWEKALASEERLGPESYAMGVVPVAPVAIPGKTKHV